MTRVKVAPLLQEARAKRKQEIDAESGRGTTEAVPSQEREEPDSDKITESADSRRAKEDRLAKQRRYVTEPIQCIV